jgi:Putative sensor
MLMLPLGTLYFTIAVTGVSTGLGLAAAPFVAVVDWLTDADIGHVELGVRWLENPIGYALCGLFGVLFLTGVLHLARGVARLHARMAKALLVTPGA